MTAIMTESEREPPIDEPPLTPKQAAKLLGVSHRTVFDIIGLEWIEYRTIRARRPIRRITPESVRRLLERRRGHR